MSAINLSKQTVNLSKGEKINLSKASEGLREVMIGMGWDPIKVGFFDRIFGTAESRYDYDLDVFVFLLQNGRFSGNKRDTIYFGNLKYIVGGKDVIKHHGDNLTGRGAAGDKEQISIDLSEIPKKYDGIMVAVTLYQGEQRRQSLGKIHNMFVRVVDKRDDFEICNFKDKSMTEDFNAQSFIVGRFVKENDEWQFEAIGQPTNDNSVAKVTDRYS